MMSRRVTVLCAAAFGAIVAATVGVAPLAAQSKSAKTIAAPSPVLVGGWSGTATVPLPDSVIVVPVLYTFTQSGTTISGQAMVPGQGTGPISNVVVTGKQVRFRVTAPEGKLLEHDGTFGADGSIEGMVNMDKQPIAKFKISPRKDSKSTPKK
ncbi:hypothetical protein [Gemmatimonas groenlandica]|uniref:Uncharacterized protein n=1 Tax=Gemmatimonas groenlandica TaxID=2732249 RepID=A0A6M4IRH6_9BACT|nr:hypothetical protein [Gemmatimonas groenlandica]QJR35452.1 hypothetical protein HKW67_07995 [Gemmatimonas groenlandica]